MKYSVISQTKGKSLNSFEKVIEWIHSNCVDCETVTVRDTKTGKVLHNFKLNADFGASNRYGVDKIK